MKALLTLLLTCFFSYCLYKLETVLLKSKAEKAYEEFTMSPVSIILTNIGYFVIALFIALGFASMIAGWLFD